MTFLERTRRNYAGSDRLMPGGIRLRDFKLLVPSDMGPFMASHDDFNKEWNRMLGL